MSEHGNNHNSEKQQSLYVVYDHEMSKVYYFGITSGPLDVNKKSARLKQHIKKGNRIAGYVRFTGRTIRYGIRSRLKIRAIEDHCVSSYRAKYGPDYPVGNADHQFLSAEERKRLQSLGDELFK